MRVLYDGWAVARAPNSPAALHLFDLLSQCPQEIEPFVALPEDAGGVAWLPEGVQPIIHPSPDTPMARLRWEQRILPRLTRTHACALLHTMSAAPALLSVPPTVISPTTFPHQPSVPHRGATARLRAALAMRAHRPRQKVLWPQDLELPQAWGQVEPLPPLIPPDFNPSEAPEAQHLASLGVTRPYVLYHGPKDDLTLRWVLAAWSWVFASLGDAYMLVLVDCPPTQAATLMHSLQDLHLGESLYPLPPQPPDVLASLYRGAQALFHPAGSVPWGGALRYALACGKPIVALETSLSDALVGPAAYLVAERDTRLLGAALLSVLVDEELARSLRARAMERIRQWTAASDFSGRLLTAYRKLVDG